MLYNIHTQTLICVCVCYTTVILDIAKRMCLYAASRPLSIQCYPYTVRLFTDLFPSVLSLSLSYSSPPPDTVRIYNGLRTANQLLAPARVKKKTKRLSEQMPLD